MVRQKWGRIINIGSIAGRARDRQPGPLRDQQGRDRRDDAQPGARAGSVRHPGERDRGRDLRGRTAVDDPRAPPATLRRLVRAETYRAPRRMRRAGRVDGVGTKHLSERRGGRARRRDRRDERLGPRARDRPAGGDRAGRVRAGAGRHRRDHREGAADVRAAAVAGAAPPARLFRRLRRRGRCALGRARGARGGSRGGARGRALAPPAPRPRLRAVLRRRSCCTRRSPS